MESHLNKVKVVIFDIGKTIFDKDSQDKVSDFFIDTIKKIKDKGVIVGCCTMRPYSWCKKMISIPLDFYICLNGSYVVYEDNVIINKRINAQNIDIKNAILYGTSNCYYSNSLMKENALNNGFLINKKGIIKNPYIISLFDVEKDLADLYSLKYNIYYWPKTKTINIQHKNTSNLKAVREIMKLLNLKDFLYFGDAPNDLEIFKYNPYSFLVKNGDPNLEKYAFAVCPSCADDGVAKTLKKIYL